MICRLSFLITVIFGVNDVDIPNDVSHTPSIIPSCVIKRTDVCSVLCLAPGDSSAVPVRHVRRGRCERRVGHGMGETPGEEEEAEVRVERDGR